MVFDHLSISKLKNLFLENGHQFDMDFFLSWILVYGEFIAILLKVTNQSFKSGYSIKGSEIFE
jgi:hypothetical protein